MVFLIDYVKAEFYQHFLLPAIGYRIFAGSAAFSENITFEDAAHILAEFVGVLHRFYGEENLSYNVHNLLHVFECHKEFGNLMGFSTYAFENYLKTMKQNVKMAKHIPQQIYNKFSDRDIILTRRRDDIIIKMGTVKSFFLNGFVYKTIAPDNICNINKSFYFKEF